MIVLQAPHELVQTTTLLPDPVFGDSEAAAVEMQLKRSMNNKVYTQVRTSGQSHLSYTFNPLTYLKALELKAFVDAYYTQNIRLTNFKDEVWVVKLLNDPFELSIIGRGEVTAVTLEMEGFKLV